MTLDPDELVELANHGPMKLRYAVARAMLLLPTERRRATIIRKGEPSVLKFKTIKELSSVLARARRLKPQKRKTSKKQHLLSRPRNRKTSSQSKAA